MIELLKHFQNLLPRKIQRANPAIITTITLDTTVLYYYFKIIIVWVYNDSSNICRKNEFARARVEQRLVFG